ncbi:Protein MB21D2 [Ooceraea biroi]|nr:Protein MB21D2 [Ooceraea biroi]
MMVQQSDHRGYVRLRRLDETPYPRNSSKQENIGTSSTADDDEIYYGDSESIYGRNSNMMLPDHIKKRGLQTTTIFNARSLPNLQDDETIYEDQVSLSRENIYGTRSNRDIKPESDCEHMSSIEDRSAHSKKLSKSDPEARKGSYQRYSRSGSAKSMRPKVHRPASSSSSGYRSGAGDSDSDWGYHSVTSNVASNRNMNHDNMAADAPIKIYSNAMIPAQCFKKVRIDSQGRIYTMRQDRKRPQNSKQYRLMIADRQYDCDVFYTSSENFMNHFVNLFVNQLAKPLGFEPEDMNHVEDSIIHCDKMIDSHSPRLRRIESYEITPSIWLQWPEDAQEWLDRPRSTWPDYNDISKVKDFGCHVVPENSIPKKRDSVRRDSRHHGVRRNIDHEIEWQLIFPAAQRYLETCMTRSQMQVYLITLMLHKTFLRPVLDTTYGLTISHIRNKLFWLIEENDRPSKWPDNRTGECLLKLLHSLYHCISQNDPILPDYFVRDKNMFKKVPSDYLLHSQKQLKRIIENPIMYVFHAMENIKHSNKFFPRLDFTTLFKILTVKPWLAVMNPALGVFVPSKALEESHMAREEIYNRSGEFWMSVRMRSEQIYDTRVVTNRTLITPRKATYSIVEIMERCAELEGPRLTALLDFFVRHFIKMAECCHRYRAYQQKQVYLDQADRLSIILSEATRYKDDAKAYHDKIYALRMRVTTNLTMRSQNEPPETPKRNQEAPIFVGSLKDRFTRQAAEVLAPPKDEQSSEDRGRSRRNREDYAESSREDHTGTVTNAIIHEVRFKDEKAETSSANAQTKVTETLRNLALKDQSNESISDAVHKVVSLTDNLAETTYI